MKPAKNKVQRKQLARGGPVRASAGDARRGDSKPCDKSTAPPRSRAASDSELSEALARAAAGAYRSGAILACKHGNHSAARVYSRLGDKIERLAIEAARAGL